MTEEGLLTTDLVLNKNSFSPFFVRISASISERAGCNVGCVDKIWATSADPRECAIICCASRLIICSATQESL